jgi:RNA polymerase sigma-70 factor (ECF subfamily)
MTSGLALPSRRTNRPSPTLRPRTMTTDAPSILDRIARGEPGADAALLDQYGGLVWTLTRRMIRNPADAEDAVQEIFADVWNSARQGRFDARKGSEATFVAMIARRRLVDRLRKRPAPGDALVEVPAAPTTDAAFETDDAARAAKAFAELTEAQQTAIRLSVVHGRSHEEVSRDTGMPLGTVKAHIRRGLIRLREALGAGPNRTLSSVTEVRS